MKKGKGLWASVVGGLAGIAAVLLIIGIVSNVWVLIPGVLIFCWLGFWVPHCYRTVGSINSPAQAVLVRWGEPKCVLSSGLHGPLWWPIDKLVIYSTKQYVLDFAIRKVYSAEDKKGRLNTKVMDVNTAVYFMWPQGDDLIKSFQRAPTPTGNFEDDTRIYTAFFEPAVDDCTRAVLGGHNDKEIRAMKTSAQKGEIEREMKGFLLSESGNAFKEAAIPEYCLDVAITGVSFDKKVEDAFSAEEVGRREGAGEGQRLMQQTEGTKSLLKAFTGVGVPPVFAPMFLQKGKEKGFDSQQLMQLAIAMRMMGVEWQAKSSSEAQINKLRTELRRMGIQKEDELIVLLQEMGII